MTEQPAIFRLDGGAAAVSPRAGARAFAGSRGFYALVSLLLLAPCYWQPRVQAGDISSHLNNAWLSQMIESGRSEGLLIVSQTTNVLFDLLLSGLFKVVGPEAAQRLAVSIAVLVFVWGAFAFVSAVAGRKPWYLLGCIAMLAYGWVYHMGFFNFYLSLGLCFWILALLWEPTPRRMLAAAPILLLAYVAHPLPFVWTLCLIGYAALARRLSANTRAALTGGWLAAMVMFHLAIGRSMITRWSLQQLTVTTGLDQMWVFDGKYFLVLAVMLTIWGVLFIDLLHRNGPRQVVSDVPFHLCAISALGVFILPGTVLIPGFRHALIFIAERMSLGVGVCVCAMLGAARPRPAVRYTLLAVALLFFAFLFRDERALNSYEDRMQDTVARLAPPATPHTASADGKANAGRMFVGL